MDDKIIPDRRNVIFVDRKEVGGKSIAQASSEKVGSVIKISVEAFPTRKTRQGFPDKIGNTYEGTIIQGERLITLKNEIMNNWKSYWKTAHLVTARGPGVELPEYQFVALEEEIEN